MLTTNRPLATLLLACAASGALAPTALAATAKKASTTTILKDCAKDSQISHRYRLADLKAAQKLAKKNKKYVLCRSALTSSIAALSGKAGKNSVSAVVKECAANGVITHRYKLATLKKAEKSLPADVRNYGDCDNSLQSQIHTLS